MMRPSLRTTLLIATLAVAGACADQHESPLAPRLAPKAPSAIAIITPGPYAQVDGGQLNTCAVTTAGAPVCWGRDALGESSPPLSLRSGVTKVSAGGDGIACALAAGGAMVCWGAPYGITNVPAALQSGALDISAAPTHACGLTGAGAVLCWTWNGVTEPIPVEAQSGITQISVSQYVGCGLKAGGAVCWWAGYGGLRPTPAVATSGITQVAAMFDDMCALTGAGGVVCWDRFGALRSVPAAAQSGITQISAGTTHMCALTSAGGVICWGDDSYGQSTVPAAAQSGIKQVGAGGVHTCAVTTAGAIICWGANFLGQASPPPPSGHTRHIMPTATFTAPYTAVAGQRLTVAFTNAKVPGVPSATTFTYAFDCGSGTFGAATSSATATCTVAHAGDLDLRGRVIDADGDYSTYSAYIYVATVGEATDYLYYAIQSAFWLDPAIQASLMDKATAFRTSIAAGKTKPACGQLGGLTNYLRAKRGKGIDTWAADDWLLQADQLQSALGC